MWKAPIVNLRPRQKAVLERIAKSRTARSDHRQRAQLMLLFAQGLSNNRAGEQVGLKSKQAGHWRKRWLAHQDQLIAMEQAQDSHRNSLFEGIQALLSDLPRSGAKPKFSAAQVAQILTLACEDPQDSGLPLSHWTLPALQQTLIQRQIVESISTSRLQVFLKSGGLKAA